MYKTVKRVHKLAGKHGHHLKKAFFYSILEAIVINGPMFLFLWVLILILNGAIGIIDVFIVALLMAVILIMKVIIRHRIHIHQSSTGYYMSKDERMAIGNHIRRLPMGFFNEGTLGNVSTVITSDMVFLEELAMDKMASIISGYLSVVVSCIIFLIINIPTGVIITCFMLVSLVILNGIERESTKISNERQIIQEQLVGHVIEYSKGNSITKAFNLSGERSKSLNSSFNKFRDIMIKFENRLTPYLTINEIILGIAIGIIIYTSSFLSIQGSLEIWIALIVVVFCFEIFNPLMALSRSIPMFRMVEAALDRYDVIMKAKPIDHDGKDIELDQFDIEFDNVNFAYEEEGVIKGMSFTAKEGTMTALVGKSGCGKTTVANLIARFWDVDNGSVKIGGIDVREHTCDSLLKHISFVFQKVYLFNDTVLNNIQFARPEATLEEVVEVCKKARCHEFISNLENGYDTMVGEGGFTLSGGEKQRISIARAMLKDAPIILLDEATTSVDPDNEIHIKAAISELVRKKTLVVIAHNLATIKNADQILVIDKGSIVQSGAHNDLVQHEGYYQRFWEIYTQESGWTL
jgi:ATP-binding cassette subfamily B protein